MPFFFIRHARANVVNDNTPPHTSPRSLGVFEDRSCQRLGNPWRARSVHRGPEVFLWKALVAQRWQERDGRDKPTTSTKRSGQFPRNPNPHRSVIPKRGHVTQRSGASPSPKSNFAAFSGKGHEVIFEFHASPYRGVSPRRRISLALLQPTPGDSTRAATRWWRTHSWEVLVWPSGLSRRPDWISALSGSFQ